MSFRFSLYYSHYVESLHIFNNNKQYGVACTATFCNETILFYFLFC